MWCCATATTAAVAPGAENPHMQTIKARRVAIPKKVRGEIWVRHFGESTKGACFCCAAPLNAFDTWHAGHIVPNAKGGSNAAENLRPVCASCNLSMGTRHMDEFKQEYYPGKGHTLWG